MTCTICNHDHEPGKSCGEFMYTTSGYGICRCDGHRQPMGEEYEEARKEWAAPNGDWLSECSDPIARLESVSAKVSAPVGADFGPKYAFNDSLQEALQRR